MTAPDDKNLWVCLHFSGENSRIAVKIPEMRSATLEINERKSPMRLELSEENVYGWQLKNKAAEQLIKRVTCGLSRDRKLLPKFHDHDLNWVLIQVKCHSYVWSWNFPFNMLHREVFGGFF